MDSVSATVSVHYGAQGWRSIHRRHRLREANGAGTTGGVALRGDGVDGDITITGTAGHVIVSQTDYTGELNITGNSGETFASDNQQTAIPTP